MKNERGPDHCQIWEQIPWVVNGTAVDSERRRVETHLEECVDCRAEFAHQQQVHAALQADTSVDGDAEAGLQRFWAGVDSVAAPAKPARASAGRRFDTRFLVGALAATVVIEAAGLVLFGTGILSHDESTQGYRTLSEAQPAAARGEIRVVLRSEMRIGELAALLDALQLEVVAGPNEAGAYALAPRPASRVQEDRLARLRATPGVQLAEPIAGLDSGLDVAR
ncbi:MAG TPA: zf-HC2 domain-containing protein [Rhodocyclaceae bacterium]|nr:zf-HC2 domain-containing protein [Rhodocyclaceae bacterium]